MFHFQFFFGQSIEANQDGRAARANRHYVATDAGLSRSHRGFFCGGPCDEVVDGLANDRLFFLFQCTATHRSSTERLADRSLVERVATRFRIAPADVDGLGDLGGSGALSEKSDEKRDHGFALPGRVGLILFWGTEAAGLVSETVTERKAQKLESRESGGSHLRRDET